MPNNGPTTKRIAALVFRVAIAAAIVTLPAPAAKNISSCTLWSDPLNMSGYRLVATANPMSGAPNYSGGVGYYLDVVQVQNVDAQFVLAVTTESAGTGGAPSVLLYKLTVDTNGQIVVPAPQSITLPSAIGIPYVKVGDVDGDGVPDVVLLSSQTLGSMIGYVYFGSNDAGILHYGVNSSHTPASSTLPAISTTPYTVWRTRSLDVGTVAGLGASVIAGATGGSTKGTTTPGAAFVLTYSSSGWTWQRILGPAGSTLEFGKRVMVANGNVVISDPTFTVAGLSDAGQASGYYYDSTANPPSFKLLPTPLNAAIPVAGEKMTLGLAYGDVGDGKGLQYFAASGSRVAEGLGPLASFDTNISTFGGGFATAGITQFTRGDGLSLLAVGAPNATDCTTSNIGAAHVYVPGASKVIFHPPSLNGGWNAYGYDVGLAAIPSTGKTVVIVGEPGRALNGSGAGQVYFYQQ